MVENTEVLFEVDVPFGTACDDDVVEINDNDYVEKMTFLESVKSDPLFYWFVTGLEKVEVKNGAGELNLDDPRLAEHMQLLCETDDSIIMQYDAILICPQTSVSIYMSYPSGKNWTHYYCVVESEDYLSTDLIECAAQLFAWVKSNSSYTFAPQAHKRHGQPSSEAESFTVLKPTNFPVAYEHTDAHDSYWYLLCPIRSLALRVYKSELNTLPVGQSKYSVYLIAKRASNNEKISSLLCTTDYEEDLLETLTHNVCYPVGDMQRPC